MTSSPPDAAARRSQAWSDYWRSGALHSCAGSYDGNYGGAIAAFWQSVFDSMPPRASVLDLCCGNAPLSKLLLERGDATAVEIDAVDAARIAPAWVAALDPARRARMRLHPGVDVAALPFAAASVELCMSQYGVEYVGAAALAEAARVLRPGGAFAAVLHHVDALPVRIARAEGGHLQWLAASEGVLAQAEAMLPLLARAATPAGRAALRDDAAANARRDAFNQSLRALEARLASADYPDLLQEVRAALPAVLQQAQAGEAAGRQALARLRRRLDDDALRQAELVACALDEAGMRALLAPLGDAAPQVRVLEFERGGIAGWAVSARRR